MFIIRQSHIITSSFRGSFDLFDEVLAVVGFREARSLPRLHLDQGLWLMFRVVAYDPEFWLMFWLRFLAYGLCYDLCFWRMAYGMAYVPGSAKRDCFPAFTCIRVYGFGLVFHPSGWLRATRALLLLIT